MPDVRQNAGRCDICGELISMAEGDRLVMPEWHDVDGFEQSDVAEAIADALEREGDSPENAMLVQALREDYDYRAHDECLDETAYDSLTTELPEDWDDE